MSGLSISGPVEVRIGDELGKAIVLTTEDNLVATVQIVDDPADFTRLILSAVEDLEKFRKRLLS